MRIVTSEQMRALDEEAKALIPGEALMENAGDAVFHVLVNRYGNPRGVSYRVACGPGNNGGDGWVVARKLARAGAVVAVRSSRDPSDLRGDALTHFRLFREAAAHALHAPWKQGIKVDALLGTGSSGEPTGKVRELLDQLQVDKEPVVSIDLPTGLDANTGIASQASIRADLTVSFGYPKRGMFFFDGPARCGDIVIDPIGFEWDSLPCPSGLEWIKPERFVGDLHRRWNSHKGDFGHVGIVGGCAEMPGALCLAALGALRSGAGLVTAFTSPAVRPAFNSNVMEAMCKVDTGGQDFLEESTLDVLAASLGSMETLVVGPGLGRKQPTINLVHRLIQEHPGILVLDADGLFAAAQNLGPLQTRAHPTILTPHEGEAARLLGCTVDEVTQDREAAVCRLAQNTRSVVVLKGGRTLIANEEGTRVAVNSTGNPGMATGGSGDVLAGVIGGLAARGLTLFDSACLGVYLHGRAGDLAAERRGVNGLIARDIVEQLPNASRELEVAR